MNFLFPTGGDFALRAGAPSGFARKREDRTGEVEQGRRLGRHRDREGEIRTRDLEEKTAHVEKRKETGFLFVSFKSWYKQRIIMVVIHSSLFTALKC